jgi:hypothetical protein
MRVLVSAVVGCLSGLVCACIGRCRLSKWACLCVFLVCPRAAADPTERTDLSKSQPEVLHQLLTRYAELAQSEVTRANSGLCETNAPNGYEPNKHKGVWEPWVPHPAAV